MNMQDTNLKTQDSDVRQNPIKMSGEKVTVHYGAKQALFDVDLKIEENQVYLPDWSVRLWQIHFPAQPSIG